MALRIPAIVCSVIAVLLQIILAPNIHILLAAPNFILAFVVAYSVANYQRAGYVLAFVLGIAYDFLGSGPIGAMALVCVLAAFFATLFMRLLDNESMFIPLVTVILVCLCAEIFYGILMFAFGYDVGLLEVFTQLILPCALYDIVISIVVYLLISRFIYRNDNQAQMTFIGTGIK